MQAKIDNSRLPTLQESLVDKAAVVSNAEVVHLPQMHIVAGMNDPVVLEHVAKSQHEIALKLKALPEAHVFAEGLTEDYTEAYYRQESQDPMSLVAVAKMYFPEGMPSEFAQLSDLQKEFLVSVGGDRTAFMLGDIKRLERSLDPQQSKIIDQEILELSKKYGDAVGPAILVDQELNKLVMDDREALLTEEVSSFVQSPKYDGAPIVIVYGAAHDLADNFSEYKFRKEEMASLVIPRMSSGFSLGPGRGVGVDERAVLGAADVKAFSTFSNDLGEAQAYYGNIETKDEAVKEAIATEQKKLLEHVIESGQSMPAWMWQHFTTPELLQEGLKVLDPGSVNDDFPLDAVKARLTATPELAAAGNEWIEKNFSTSGGQGHSHRTGDSPD